MYVSDSRRYYGLSVRPVLAEKNEENEEDEKAEEILEQCDDIFYENEEQINHLLEQYANELEI